LARVNVVSSEEREELRKGTGGFMGYCSYVSGKKKFGVEFKTKITDMGSPRNDSVLEVEWCWDNWTTPGE
jgi:hypothetical protein